MTFYLPCLQSGMHQLIHEQIFTYPLGPSYLEVSALSHPNRTLTSQNLITYPHLCQGDLGPRRCASLTHISIIQIYGKPAQDALS